MKNLLTFLLLLCMTWAAQAQPINAIVGDSAWYLAHGEWPSSHLKDSLRIDNHLRYVRHRLSATKGPLGQRRNTLLAYLDQYLLEGQFPSQFKYEGEGERRPCFIDDQGTYCAVGYLMMRDGKEELAQSINKRMRFHYLLDMEDAELLAWQESSGFSLKELAMIQPTYDFPEPVRLSGYEQYISDWTGKWGVRKARSKWPVIWPRFEFLTYSENQGFAYGKREGRWYAFDGEMNSIPDIGLWKRKDYDSLQIQLGAEYEYVLSYFENNKVGTLDRGGTEYPAVPYQECVFYRGSSYFQLKDSTGWSLYNYKMEKLNTGSFDRMEPIFGLYKVLIALKVERAGQQWLLDVEGHPFTGPWTSIRYARGMFIAAAADGKERFLLNAKGDTLTEDLIEVQAVAGKYLSAVQTEKGFRLYEGNSGQPYFNTYYQELIAYPNIQFKVRKDSLWGIIDFREKAIVDVAYSAVWPLGNYYSFKSEEGMGLISNRGELKIEAQYDTLGVLVQDGHFGDRQIYFGLKGGYYTLIAYDFKVIEDSLSFDCFDRVTNASVLLKKGGESPRLLHYLKGKTTLVALPMERVQAIGSNFYIYQRQGKYGLWASWSHLAYDPQFLKPAVYDSILPVEKRQFNYFLVQQKGLWGIYSFNLDSLAVPLEYDAFSPSNLDGGQQWIYLRKQGTWFGFYPTSPKLHYLHDAAQGKLEEEWKKR